MSSSTEMLLDPDEVAAAFADLPTLAPVALEVLRLIDDDRASVEDIAVVLARDPALTAQILRVSNSAMYGMGGRTTSLARAATVLGLRTLKLLALSFSVITRPDLADLDAQVLWRHTLATGAMARTIAAARDPRMADECFIVGLLCDIGRFALSQYPSCEGCPPGKYLWRDSADELIAFGCTSDAVTASILDMWGLPAMLGDAMRHRSDPKAARGAAARIAKVLNVADAAARLIIAESGAAGTALTRYHHSAAEHLELDEEEADRLLTEAAPALAEIAIMFSSAQPHDVPVETLLIRAKQGLARLSLETVTALSQEQLRSQQLALENQRLTTESTTDALTSLANRRAYDRFLADTLAARVRRGDAGIMGLLMIDLDRFKSINDMYGHTVGDNVLRLMGARIALNTRRDEFAARIGGEEFAVVLPTTDPEKLAAAAERFRCAIGDVAFTTVAGPRHITASIGAAWLEDVGQGAALSLYEAADAALLEAKSAGRNRVVSTPVR